MVNASYYTLAASAQKKLRRSRTQYYNWKPLIKKHKTKYQRTKRKENHIETLNSREVTRDLLLMAAAQHIYSSCQRQKTNKKNALFDMRMDMRASRTLEQDEILAASGP